MTAAEIHQLGCGCYQRLGDRKWFYYPDCPEHGERANTPRMVLHIGTTGYGVDGWSADAIFRLGVEKAHGCRPDLRDALLADPKVGVCVNSPHGHSWLTKGDGSHYCQFCGKDLA